MKTTKVKMAAVMLIGVALVFAACEPKPKKGKGGSSGEKGGLSKTEKLIKCHIDDLAVVTNWADAQKKYKDNEFEIDKYVIRTNLKKDYHDLNKKAFCHSMDTIMYGILTVNTCKNNHNLLEEVHATRVKEDFASISTNLNSEVDQLYKTHKEIQSFISNAKRDRQDVHSYQEEYDIITENKLKQKASDYLKKGMKCDEINTGLQSVANGSVFKNRRKDFCDKVVQLYLNAGEYSSQEQRKLGSKIRSFSEFFDKRGEPLNDDAKKWVKDLQTFEMEHADIN